MLSWLTRAELRLSDKDTTSDLAASTSMSALLMTFMSTPEHCVLCLKHYQLGQLQTAKSLGHPALKVKQLSGFAATPDHLPHLTQAKKSDTQPHQSLGPASNNKECTKAAKETPAL